MHKIAMPACPDSGQRQSSRPGAERRWVTAGGYTVAAVALFGVYLRLSELLPENSDMANILLMASDMLHGNLLLHGWYTSDVSFYTTELPQYAILESFLGLREETAHAAAAMTYTLAFLLTVMLARNRVRGGRAAARTLVAAAIMLAPQLNGVYALDIAVGHIGTAVPLLVICLLLDRAGRRWWVPPLAAMLLGWALVADPLVLFAGVVPLLLAACVPIVKGLVRGRLDARELGLAGAAPAAVLLAWAAKWLLREQGGYIQAPLGVSFRPLHQIASSTPYALWQVLDLFGADFAGLRGVALWLAVAHLVSVALVIAAVVLVTSRYFGQRTLVDRILVVAVVGLVFGYVITTASNSGAHEIALVEPLAAALTARTLVAPAASGWLRRAGWAASGLVLACYLAGLGWEISQPATPPQFTGLASWLATHHLTDGLASYWDASIVTVDSGGQVRVRALDGAMRPYLWMTDQQWYDPASGRADFLILSSQPYFGGTWAQPQIIARFGQPAQTYHIGVFTVLVWHHNLLTQAAAAAPR